MKKKTLVVVFILIIFLIIFGVVSSLTLTIKDEKLTSIQKEMIEPKIIVIPEKNEKYKDRYLIIYDNKDKSKIELFDLKTKETKPLPKPNLKGENQTLIGGETLYNINIVQTNPKDILGIEFFDLDSFTWKKLKTIPTIRKKADNMPSYQSIRTVITKAEEWLKDKIKGKETLFIWGGINNKTNKQQNTLEIIGLKQDKLIMNTYFPFQDGQFFENRRAFVGKKTIKEEFKNKYMFEDLFYLLNVVSNEEDSKLMISYFKDEIQKDPLSSYATMLAFGFIDKNNDFKEIILLEEGEPEIYVEKINLPKKYKNYKVTNIFEEFGYYKQILVLEKGNRQNFLRIKNCYKEKKETDFKFRFSSIYLNDKRDETNKNLNHENVMESYSNKEYKNGNIKLYKIENNKIYTIIIEF